MTVGDIILSIINFLTYPTWHLVVLYVVLLLFVAWYMIKSWGF
ncbi:MAG: hypothetical protein ABIJ84_00255 [bacterium]